MLYSWWLLDGQLFPGTARVPPPPEAVLLGYSVAHTLGDELFIASFCGLQAAELADQDLNSSGSSVADLLVAGSDY